MFQSNTRMAKVVIHSNVRHACNRFTSKNTLASQRAPRDSPSIGFKKENPTDKKKNNLKASVTRRSRCNRGTGRTLNLTMVTPALET